MKNILVIVATMVSASTVMAQSYTCHTNSRGQSFSDSSWDIDTARNQTTAECRQNSVTVNAECDANVYCDGGGSVTCSTNSRGYPFQSSGSDKDSVVNQVLNECHANASTSNAECDANITCNGDGGGGFFPPPPPPPPECKPGFNCPGDNPPVMASCSESSRNGDQVTYYLSGPFANQSASFGTDLGGQNFRNRSVTCNGMEATVSGLNITPGYPGQAYVTLSPSKPGFSLSGCRIDVSQNWQTTSYNCN